MTATVIVKNPTTITQKYFYTDKDDSLNLDDFKIKISTNTFYENAILHIEKTNTNRLSASYFIGNKNNLIPLQKSTTISFQSSIRKKRNKIVIVRQDKNGKEQFKATAQSEIWSGRQKNTVYLWIAEFWKKHRDHLKCAAGHRSRESRDHVPDYREDASRRSEKRGRILPQPTHRND